MIAIGMKLSKHMNNQEVKDLLEAVAAAYEIKDEKKNRYRIMAYDRAASAVEHLSSEIKDVWEDDKLTSVPGIGPSIAQHLNELFETGTVNHFEEVLEGLPPAMFELLNIKGIGPKTSFKLCQKLKIVKAENALEKVKQAAENEEIREIEGFGEESEKNILQSIKDYEKIGSRKKRMTLPYAESLASKIIKYMNKCEAIEKINPLGSLRRRAATVGDIDLAASSKQPEKVVEHFTGFSQTKDILESGERDASIELRSGHQIDLKIQHPRRYGALLQHYTGSKHHNIHLRNYAKKRNLSLSEYGIKDTKTKERHEFNSEKKFYNFLDLPFIPPELREDTGEIEAAQHNNLPDLITLDDVKGDLHIHSDFEIEPSHDLGQSSMKTMIKQAQELGYEYVCFSEHNPSQKNHNKEDILSILKRKSDYIEQNKSTWSKKYNINVLNGLEVDILPNGELPLPEKAFDYLDFVIVSVHSSFDQSRKKMTQRIIDGLSHPKAKIIGHPTGRKIGQREAYEVDWDKLFKFCRKKNKVLEINAWPDRLDLPDNLVRDAVENRVKMVINTDAHNVIHMEYIKYGVFVARRGWTGKNDIINTMSFKEIINYLDIKKGGEN
jgi:DNA polymerase (family 10)